MSELHDGLHHLADRASGDVAGTDGGLAGRLDAVRRRVRRRRVARTASTSVAAVTVVAVAGLGAAALADRDPAPTPPVAAPVCGAEFQVPPSDVPDLRLLVGLSGALPALDAREAFIATGDRTYSAAGDPVTGVVL
ncbi:MAG TPA: hypothetical protein PKB06_06030, partial [Actinotalea sp.]|nr:hypothetical protein [Actinotalea sp.]